MPEPSPATELLARTFADDGYAVVPNLVAPAEMGELRDAVEAVAHDQERFPAVKRTWVERNGERHVGHLFFPHLHHPLFDALTRRPDLLEMVAALLGGTPCLYTTQVMLKAPNETHHVFKPHQDCYYWQFMPFDVVTCWLAVDDATLDNGCLRVLPGSHRGGLLPHTNYASSVNDALLGIDNAVDYEAELIDVPVAAGNAVFFHGLTIHSSRGNTTAAWRRAIGIIYMLDAHAASLSAERQALGWRS